MSDKIARAVRILRVTHDLTQKDFASKVFQDDSEHGFKKVSRIERGQELTDNERKQIEDYFRVVLADISTATSDQDLGELALLTDEEYFQHQTNFVERVCPLSCPTVSSGSPCPVEFWFFHPLERLPVVTSPMVRRRWLENLRRGINKHLLWPIPTTTRGDLEAFVELALALSSQLQDSSPQVQPPAFGKITFWACDSICGAMNHSIRSRYEQLAASLNGTSRAILFNPVLDIGDDSAFEGIVEFHSVMLALTEDPSLSRYAVSFLDDVCSEPAAPGVSGWLFLGVHKRNRLIRVVERLRAKVKRLYPSHHERKAP